MMIMIMIMVVFLVLLGAWAWGGGAIFPHSVVASGRFISVGRGRYRTAAVPSSYSLNCSSEALTISRHASRN